MQLRLSLPPSSPFPQLFSNNISQPFSVIYFTQLRASAWLVFKLPSINLRMLPDRAANCLSKLEFQCGIFQSLTGLKLNSSQLTQSSQKYQEGYVLIEYGCFGALGFFLTSTYNYCVLPRLKIFWGKLCQKHRFLVQIMRLNHVSAFLVVGYVDRKLKFRNFPQYSSFYRSPFPQPLAQNMSTSSSPKPPQHPANSYLRFDSSLHPFQGNSNRDSVDRIRQGQSYHHWSGMRGWGEVGSCQIGQDLCIWCFLEHPTQYYKQCEPFLLQFLAPANRYASAHCFLEAVGQVQPVSQSASLPSYTSDPP